MRKIVLLVLILLAVQADYFKEINLLDYAQIVSSANHVNILIDKNIKDKKISFFFPKTIKPFVHLQAFKDVLLEYGLYLSNRGSFYIVKQINSPVIRKRYYYYKLKYLNIDDVKSLLSVYPNLKYSYLSNVNSLVFFTDKDTFLKLSHFLKKLDLPKRQKSIRITIFFTDQSRLSDIGSNVKNLGFDINHFIKLLYPDNQTNIIASKDVFQFKTFINYLVQHGYSQVIQKPSILLRDHERVQFKVVKNIPYLISRSIVQNNQTQNIVQYQYKDVGLTISILPKIFSHYVVLNMNLLIENILSLSDRPITSKISLNNSFKLSDGNLLILSGFIQSDHKFKRSGVPVLKDVPVLKYLFSYKKKSKSNYLLSIFVETI